MVRIDRIDNGPISPSVEDNKPELEQELSLKGLENSITDANTELDPLLYSAVIQLEGMGRIKKPGFLGRSYTGEFTTTDGSLDMKRSSRLVFHYKDKKNIFDSYLLDFLKDFDEHDAALFIEFLDGEPATISYRGSWDVENPANPIYKLAAEAEREAAKNQSEEVQVRAEGLVFLKKLLAQASTSMPLQRVTDRVIKIRLRDLTESKRFNPRIIFGDDQSEYKQLKDGTWGKTFDEMHAVEYTVQPGKKGLSSSGIIKRDFLGYYAVVDKNEKRFYARRQQHSQTHSNKPLPDELDAKSIINLYRGLLALIPT